VGSRHTSSECQQRFPGIDRGIIENPFQESCQRLSQPGACDSQRLEIGAGDRKIAAGERIGTGANF
jgi:hypothetical protein